MKNYKEKMETIRGTSIRVRFVTDKPVKKTPYQIKGAFIKHFPQENIVPLLDGRYRKRFLYPRVQVKILEEQLYMIGIKEAVNPIKSFVKKIKTLEFENITLKVEDAKIEQSFEQFHTLDYLIKYNFVTPWIALNKETGSDFQFLNNLEKSKLLNQLIGQNILFLAREMGSSIKQNLYTKLFLKSFDAEQLEDKKLWAFHGDFQTNIILPDYIGLGNGITRGYGTILRDGFHSEHMNRKSQPTNISEDTNNKKMDLSDPELMITNIKRIIKFKNKTPSNKLGKRKKNNQARISKNVYKKKREREYKAKDSVQKFITDESEFNSSKYHKKQHEI